MSTQEFGVFLRPPESVVDPNAFGVSIEEAVNAGFACGDMLAPPRGKRGETETELIRQALEEHGVRVLTMFVGVEGETYSTLSDAVRQNGIVQPETREARIVEIFEVAALAKGVGCNRVGLHPGLITWANVDEMAQVIQQIVDRLAAMEMFFVIETGPVELPVLRALWALVNRPDNLYFNFDPGNVILYLLASSPEEYLAGVIKCVNPRRILIHAKDAKLDFDPNDAWRGGRDVQIGKGQVRFHLIMDLLGDEGVEAPIVIEREPAAADKHAQISDVCAGRTHLQKFMF